MVLSFQEVVRCDDGPGWDVSVGKVESKQDWFGLNWTGPNRSWFVKGGRRQAVAGQGRAGCWMEKRSNKRFFVMQQKVDRLKGRELCGCNAMSKGRLSRSKLGAAA